jgi:truncated hemoglobin YjbI
MSNEVTDKKTRTKKATSSPAKPKVALAAKVPTKPKSSTKPKPQLPAAAPAPLASTSIAPAADIKPEPIEVESNKTEISAYETLGSDRGIRKTVESLFKKLRGDPRINHLLFNVNAADIQELQVVLLAKATGGPDDYCSVRAKKVFAPLRERGLKPLHCEVVNHHLENLLKATSVSSTIVHDVMKFARKTQADLFTK